MVGQTISQTAPDRCNDFSVIITDIKYYTAHYQSFADQALPTLKLYAFFPSNSLAVPLQEQ